MNCAPTRMPRRRRWAFGRLLCSRHLACAQVASVTSGKGPMQNRRSRFETRGADRSRPAGSLAKPAPTRLGARSERPAGPEPSGAGVTSSLLIHDAVASCLRSLRVTHKALTVETHRSRLREFERFAAARDFMVVHQITRSL